jgi:hypothetical protein
MGAEMGEDDASLAGMRRRGLDLSGAFLEAADLEGVVLAKANLGGARPGALDLSGATLGQCNLIKADLHGARGLVRRTLVTLQAKEPARLVEARCRELRTRARRGRSLRSGTRWPRTSSSASPRRRTLTRLVGAHYARGDESFGRHAKKARGRALFAVDGPASSGSTL